MQRSGSNLSELDTRLFPSSRTPSAEMHLNEQTLEINTLNSNKSKYRCRREAEEVDEVKSPVV